MAKPTARGTDGSARGRLTQIPPVQYESTVDLIAARLRTAIFSGALPVGSHLGEVDLSEQLGVSRGPLREAAQRLVSDRLLVARRRGLAVPTLTLADVDDVYLARTAIEQAACRRLLRCDGDGPASLARAIKALRKCHQRMLRAASRRPDARAIGDADIAFHRTLVNAAESPRLSGMIDTLLIETRLCTYSLDSTFRVREDLPDTHLVIIEALESGDEQRVMTVIETHMSAAAARLDSGHIADGTIAAAATPRPRPLDPLDPLDLPTV